MIGRSAAVPETHRSTKEDQVPGQVRDVRQDLEDPWREIQRELAASVHEDTYRLWFSPLTPVSRRGATLYLTGPQRVVRWVGRRYMDLLRAATRPRRRRPPRGRARLPGRPGRRLPGLRRGRLPGRPQPRLHLRALRDRPRQPARPRRRPGRSPRRPARPTTPSSSTAPRGSARPTCSARSPTTCTATAPSSPSTTRPPSRFTNEFVSSLHGAGIEGFKERYRRPTSC